MPEPLTDEKLADLLAEVARLRKAAMRHELVVTSLSQQVEDLNAAPLAILTAIERQLGMTLADISAADGMEEETQLVLVEVARLRALVTQQEAELARLRGYFVKTSSILGEYQDWQGEKRP